MKLQGHLHGGVFSFGLVQVWFHIWRDVGVWKAFNDASSYRRAKSAEYKSSVKVYEDDRDGEISYLVWISLKEWSRAHLCIPLHPNPEIIDCYV